MIHESTPVGPFACNCHILACERTKEGVIIDPGDQADTILAIAKDLGITVKHLVHTHCHLDHITGTRGVKEGLPEAGILIHQADAPLYENLTNQARMFGWDARDPLDAERYLVDGEEIRFGDHAIRVIHTPGHTPGSCSFAVGGDLFSGDTLFARSIGRTDLWGGNYDQEIESIRTRLLALPDDTVVHPGHGPDTRIGEERRKNPFLT